MTKKKQKHLTPRDSGHNKDLPDFWRRNFDYGKSPYMHIDSIEKITDKPSFKKKKKSYEAIERLVRLSDKLDKLGLYKEASEIDDILRAIAKKEEGVNNV